MAEELSFQTLPLSPELQQVVRELGYEKLTPIQAKSIPLLLEGRDLIGQSRTGSGKTAAFSLPILNQLRLRQRRLQALVLCPTRELCAQVAREFRRLGRLYPGLHVLVLSGGQPIRPQIFSLEKGAHIAVGTPGRILDHLGRGTLDLSEVGTVVLDEADRMLDMGFQDDMEDILSALPSRRQTVFFSATYPDTIDGMSRRYQRDPARVTIEEMEPSAPLIQQSVFSLDADRKLDALLELFARHRPESAIVFCNLKATVTELAHQLNRAGVSAAGLQGDLTQADRDRVMAKFRNRSKRVLVATDVAARGIDVSDLDLVVNFDLPVQPEIYVHRIGRTGRAGKTGLAFTFAMPSQEHRLRELEAYLGRTLDREQTIESPGEGGREPLILDQGAEMDTLSISGGRKEKVRPGDILGALTGEAGGLSATDVGKIEIHDHFSYVAVSRRVSRVALESLRNGRIKGRRFRIEKV